MIKNGILELEFGPNPNAEHKNIMRSKVSGTEKQLELGMRLARFAETGDWERVTEGGPYKTWTDYLTRGVKVHRSTAYVYIAASSFPLYAALENPLEKLYYLRAITDHTVADESVEQALAMLLPQDLENERGERERFFVPFRQLTVEQTQAAWNLIRTGEDDPLYAGTPEAEAALERLAQLTRWQAAAKAKAGGDGDGAVAPDLGAAAAPPPPEVPPEVAALERERLARQKAAREACIGALKPAQLKLRERGGKLLWDLRGVEDELLHQVVAALGTLPRRQ